MKIIISGGPYSGKTTVLNALKELGYKTIDEAGTMVISAINQLMGVESQIRWRKKNIYAFQTLIWETILQLENNLGATSSIVFCERGMLDGLAFCKLSDISPPDGYSQYLTGKRYAAAFILDTISDFKSREADGKIATYEKSILLGRYLNEIYYQFGIPTFTIKECPVEKRIENILNKLDELNRYKGSPEKL